MATQPKQPRKRIRIVRSKNVLTKEYIDDCKALQEKILKRRDGQLLPSSVDDIRAMREGELR